MELQLKQSWDAVTIKDYMNYKCALEDPNTTDFEKNLDVLAIMCGIERSVLMPLPARQVTGLFNKLEFLQHHPNGEAHEFYDIGGIRYKLVNNVKDLTAAQFIDLSHYTKDNDLVIDNLHLICAALLLPVKEYKGKKTKIPTEKYGETPIEETAENLYNNMPITEALGISSFFTFLFSLFTEITIRYLKEEQTRQLSRASKMLKQIKPMKPSKGIGFKKSGNGLQ